ncbi:MAG: GDSL-type esterase/lipase family protein [Anaerolineae bacterium]|nr:GDSL-type esterase/lipase family protein [Anaerolineae bacterium]MDW8070069.1 GDSL-type esterase/lipase family protein [Anaerolineae bacterium]
MRTLRTLFGRLALVGLGTVLPLLLLEGMVRLAGVAPPAELHPPLWEPHPYLGWFHVPNSGGVVSSEYGEFQVVVHINARGLRDREIGYAKPTGISRVLILGDSFAEALQVPLEVTFAKQLEAKLNNMGHRVEVINAGVGGWGTDQEAIFYAIEGFRYQPELVLLLFFPHNDVLNNYAPLEVARLHGAVQKPFFRLEGENLILPTFPFTHSEASKTAPAPLLPVGEWLNQHSALYRFLIPRLRENALLLRWFGSSGLLGVMAVFAAQDPPVPLLYGVYQRSDDPQWQEAWALTAAIIRRLATEINARGGQLAVVIIGAPEQIYPERWAATLQRYSQMADQEYDLDLPNRRIARILEEAKIPYFDLLPVFRSVASRADAPPLHFRHDGHWTPAGHRLAAETLSPFVARLLISDSDGGQGAASAPLKKTDQH